MSSPATVKGDLADKFLGDGSCRLLGPTALVVQALLGIFVILSLVYKRHREPRKRPWRIWLFDVSKQVVGQMFVHGVNVLLSDLVSHYTDENACVFYFLHILLDTTLGVGALYIILRGLTHVVTEKLQLKGFESGIYGHPPSFHFWLRQATLYVMALSTMKFLVIMLLILFPGIFSIGEWLLSWTQIGKGDSVQVIFVMGIFPIVMNVIQFWLIDSIVKASGSSQLVLEGRSPDLYQEEPLFHAPDDDDDNDYQSADVEQGRSQPSSTPASRFGNGKHLSTMIASEELSETIDHSYPPSLSSSISSIRPAQPKEAKNLLKKVNRRALPVPLDIHDQNCPALSFHFPGTPPGKDSLSQMPLVLLPENNVKVIVHVDDGWAETWEDSDDWANRIGEESDKPGLRTERTMNPLHESTILVGS